MQDALEDLKKGWVGIVVDDEHRENEGDLIYASECITPELVNFILKEARCLMFIALTKERCTELKLTLMVSENTALYKTAFTVSVDLLGFGCTSGVSAFEVSLSKRELYTFIAKKNTGPRNKKTVVA